MKQFSLVLLSSLIFYVACSNNVYKPAESRAIELTENKKTAEIELGSLEDSYRNLLSKSPTILQKNLKKEQSYWLEKSIDKCTYFQDEALDECLANEYRRKRYILEKRNKTLLDILDNELIGINDTKHSKEKICDFNVPYIKDAKYFLVHKNCINLNDAELLVQNKIVNIYFDEDDELKNDLNFEMENQYGSLYTVTFRPSNNSYLLIIFGHWGVIKDLNFSGYTAPKNTYK